jgi:hypothetical protein
MRRSDLEQAIHAGADHEQAVAGTQTSAILSAEHARERLDQRCRDGVECFRKGQQFSNQVGRHPDSLCEATRLDAQRPEPLAQRFVTPATAAALAARGVVMDRDPIPDLQVTDAVADRADDPRGLVAEDGGELALDVPVGHVGGAHPACEDIAHDLAGLWDRVLDMLDPDIVEGDRAGDPHL